MAGAIETGGAADTPYGSEHHGPFGRQGFFRTNRGATTSDQEDADGGAQDPIRRLWIRLASAVQEGLDVGGELGVVLEQEPVR
jgi:hypothetical protein